MSGLNLILHRYLNIISGILFLLDEGSSVIYASENWSSMDNYKKAYIILMIVPVIVQAIPIMYYIYPDYRSLALECFPKDVMFCLVDFFSGPYEFYLALYKKKIQLFVLLRVLIKVFTGVLFLPLLLLSWLVGTFYMLPYTIAAILAIILYGFHSIFISMLIWLRIPYFAELRTTLNYVQDYKRRRINSFSTLLNILIILAIFGALFGTMPLFFVKVSINSSFEEWHFINSANLAISVITICYQLIRGIHYWIKGSNQNFVYNQNNPASIINQA